MTDDDDPWQQAVGAWVPLADLLSTVERELRVPRADAARVLKHALESYGVNAEVLISGFDAEYLAAADWTFFNRYGGAPRVAEKGWQHVDWKAGTLAGYPVRVLWAHVVESLARIPRRSAGALAARTSIGSETALTRWLTDQMRANLEAPRPRAQMMKEASAATLKFSKGAFGRAWSRAVIDSGATAWSTAGRRPKSN